MSTGNNSGEMLIKLLIIGDSSVGKSCLIRRFAEDKFDPNFLPTIGVDFKVRRETIDDAKVKLQIWDTAGHEKFRSITKAYFHGANGVLLVFDVTNRDSFLQTKTWMTSITETVSDPIEVILIGNKVDDVLDESSSQRMVSKEEGEQMAAEFNVPYMETSAKTGYNVEETFMKIAVMAKRRKDKEPPKPDPKPILKPKDDKKKKEGCC